MAEDKGFNVNDFEHLEEAKQPGLEHRREASGWGIVRDDLVKHHVRMLTDVHFIWSDDTPPEMRKAFGEASLVIHHIAEKAVMEQLRFDGLAPVETRDVFYAQKDGEQITLRDSGWGPVE